MNAEFSVEDGTIVHIPREGWTGDLHDMGVCVGSDCEVDRVTYAHHRVENKDDGWVFTYIPDSDEVNEQLPKSRVTSSDAAAFWGSAENLAYPIEQRLKLALTALEFFGKEYEKLTGEAETPTKARQYDLTWTCDDGGFDSVSFQLEDSVGRVLIQKAMLGQIPEIVKAFDD